MTDILVPIDEPVPLLAILLAVLAVLFAVNRHPKLRRVYKFLPLLVFAYFVPTVLSNTGVIPTESPVYSFIKTWFLPASLLLLTMSVDIPAILRLGPKVLTLFFTATASIVIGGPIAYAILHGLAPEQFGDDVWKGLAALSGSWIGGTANMVAIGDGVGVDRGNVNGIWGLIIIVDVAVANVWMIFLLFFTGREKQMDEKLGVDRRALDELRTKVENFHRETARPTTLADLLLICAIAIGGTVLAVEWSKQLPEIGNIISGTTWVVIIVTTMGVGLSFTPLRRLEGVGASAVGSVFLYLLVASIGARGDFSQVANAPGLVAIGALWMAIHAVTILLMRYYLRAPIFFAAVGSKANIGGAASAPIVASAFHPALAPVGVLLAVAGYVLGTYAGLLCAFLLEKVYHLVG